MGSWYLGTHESKGNSCWVVGDTLFWGGVNLDKLAVDKLADEKLAVDKFAAW